MIHSFFREGDKRFVGMPLSTAFSSYSSIDFMTRAGTPTATELGEISRVTMLPAPTITLSSHCYAGHDNAAITKIDIGTHSDRLDDVDIRVLIPDHPHATVVSFKHGSGGTDVIT